MHTVKEASQITGLTEHTVRFYTDKGLKQSGMPIEVIKMYIDLCLEGDSTIPQRFALMMEHKEAALAKLEEAKQHVAHLVEKTALYQAILEHRSPDTTNPGNWDKTLHMHSDVFYSSTVRKA